MAIKLNKEAREILQNAAQSERAHGVKKPITVFARYRNTDMTGFSKRFIRYCQTMWKLIDADLIGISNPADTYAYIVDLSKIDEALN